MVRDTIRKAINSVLESPSNINYQKYIDNSIFNNSIIESINNIDNLKRTLEVLSSENYHKEMVEVLERRRLDIDNLIEKYKELYNI